HLSPIGPRQPHDHGENRGLARPVRPQKPHRLAASHGEGDVAHHGAFGKALGKTVGDEPAGLVDRTHQPPGVKVEVTRPPPPPEVKDEVPARVSITSRAALTVPVALTTTTEPEKVRT